MILAGITLLPLVSAHGQQSASPGSKPIIFSDPTPGLGSSNLNQINPSSSVFDSLEGHIKKPYQPFDSRGTPQLRSAPPPRLSSKQLQQLLEKQKEEREWIFKSPDDFFASPSMEEVLGVQELGPDGQPRKKKSPLESFYDRFDSTRASNTNSLGLGANESLFRDPNNPDDRTSYGLSASENKQGWMQVIPGSPNGSSLEPLFPETAKNPTLVEILNGSRITTSDPSRGHQDRMEEFRKLLNSGSMTPAPSTFDRSRSPLVAVPPPVKSAPLAPVLSSPGAFSSSISPAYNASVQTPNLPSTAPSWSSSVSTIAPVEQPARAPIAAPSFAVPKRRF